MGDKDDYLTSYRVFFENFAATVNPEDQLPVQIAGYTISEAELPGEVIYWTTQYLTEKQCPSTLMTPLRRIILEEVRVASKKQPSEFGYVPDDSVYIALRLMQAVTARVNDVCLRYLDNSRLDSLPPPPPPALREYRTVSAATKNSRRVMEDRHVEIGNLEALFGIDTTEPTSFYAVYDGHAGSAAATYCAAHLHQYLLESPRFNTDLESAMHDAFLRTDAEFVRKSNQERVYGGSTAVVVCVRARRLLVAWVGDSQALLAKRMRLMQLVNPHKPDREDERERIESSGGTVMHWGTWRVNGQLAVSRAIGDAQYKPYVTARPEMGVVELDGDEDFVVVACDGLWDVVSEDAVALAVYQELASEPDDLKAVAKRLVVQAKRVGSVDNISVIVVFLKNPRDIVADNYPPMDLGLDNAAVNAPPFAVEADPRKPAAAVDATGAVGADADADNGVSDSDSEDLGPETAVDIDAEVEVDRDDVDDHGMDQAAAPTPPAHAVEEGHVDGNLVDNVAESGEDSEDEWNYYKGEGDREQNVSEEADEPPRSETPCQDNSAWESSSVDMNSSPLNPEAPVFVPGTVAGTDMLLAESPRKPLPMDDIELPDVAQFNTEAVVRPAELLDLDNCDQLNGHHNISMEGVTEHLNGNEKCEMDGLGLGFNVSIDSEKIKDTELIQDFERIQKDTTDFCNIQVLQTHTAYNPFAADGDEELFERLKNKERDPMSMSFYQEKDDDTCERFGKIEPQVDLNAVQPLPDSDDEDMQTNGVCDNIHEDDKENVSPELENLLDSDGTQTIQEPNNDIMMFDDRSGNNVNNLNSFMDFNITNANNVQSFSNVEFECSNVSHENVAPTDTPESHKLLFEQIPEIPDGKSSELGFTNEDMQDPCESDTRVITPQEEISQEIDIEDKLDESPSEEIQPDLDISNEHIEITQTSEELLPVETVHKDLHNENETISEFALDDVSETLPNEQVPLSPEPEPTSVDESTNNFTSNQIQTNVVVDIHQNSEQCDDDKICEKEDIILESATPEIKSETEIISTEVLPEVATSKSPLPADASLPQSPLPSESLMPADSPLLSETLIPSESPLPVEPIIEQEYSPVQSKSPIVTELINEPVESPVDSPVEPQSPLPIECHSHSPLPVEEDTSKVPLPAEVPLPRESPIPSESPLPDDEVICTESKPFDSSTVRKSPFPVASPLPSVSPLPTEAQVPVESQLPIESQSQIESPLAVQSLLPVESPLPSESPLPTESPLPAVSPIPAESPLPAELSLPVESPLPAESSLPAESPVPIELPVPTESQIPAASPLPSESLLPIENAIEESFTPFGIHRESPLSEELSRDSPISVEAHRDSPLPIEELNEIISPSDQLSDFVPAIDDVATSADVASPTNFEIDSAAITKSPLPEERRSPLPVETVCELRLGTASPRSSPMPDLATEAIEETTTPPPVEIEQSHVEPEKAPSPVTLEAPQVALDEAEPTDVLHETPAATDIVAPAPDIVPDRLRTELVTDIDIGIPESRAQEICVPVTNEIQHDDAMQPGATPPPTPAVELAVAPDLASTPLDAPIEPASVVADVPLAAAAAVGIAAAATAAAAGVAKAKTPTAKKSPITPTSKTDVRTPKSAPKPSASAPRTPASAKRPTAPAAPAKTPTSTTKTPTARVTPSKAPSSASKTATSSSKPSAAAPARLSAKPAAPPPKAATRPAAATVKEAPAVSKSYPTTRAAAPRPATKPAAKPAAPTAKPAAVVPASAKPAVPRTAATARPTPVSAARTTATAKPKETKPKAPEKPVTNGDVKSAKPAPRPASARPVAAAPRPTQRAPAAAPLTKPAAPKPATRAPLDKQSKDLANKRITAKAAPPRTAPIKAPLSARTAVTKPGAKKVPEKTPAVNGLPNGAGAEPIKAPPSPPATDNALLPDVIA